MNNAPALPTNLLPPHQQPGGRRSTCHFSRQANLLCNLSQDGLSRSLPRRAKSERVMLARLARRVNVALRISVISVRRVFFKRARYNNLFVRSACEPLGDDCISIRVWRQKRLVCCASWAFYRCNQLASTSARCHLTRLARNAASVSAEAAVRLSFVDSVGQSPLLYRDKFGLSAFAFRLRATQGVKPFGNGLGHSVSLKILVSLNDAS